MIDQTATFDVCLDFLDNWSDNGDYYGMTLYNSQKILVGQKDFTFGYNIVIGIPITNDSKKGPVGVPFAIDTCDCIANTVHPKGTLRRHPNLLQHLFPMR